ncbi:DUF3829 domain-containing protein [Terrimonas rubra]|uniref:DUF3829 domain-containing protein n=1 Tax=Terrimonas rubra TaxID=1035890 RepID=A0ABW6A9E0_9BACT
MKKYPAYILTIALLMGIMLFNTSCGNNKGTPDDKAAAAADEAGDDKALQEKMSPYVEVINEVSKPLNKGYSYYLNYVQAETGEPLTKGAGVYFMPEIKNADAKLTAIENAAKAEPKADIDQYAAAYVTKAKEALNLHNQLAAYYQAKENLVDNHAKGLALHKDYIAALTDFKTTAQQVAAAYDKYYKEGNAKYIARLEQKGDKVRVAANLLMNEAEVLQSDFYAAIPAKGPITITPELEAVMTRTGEFQKLIAAFNTAEQSISEADKKKFFRAGTIFSFFSGKANTLLTQIRSVIDKLKQDPKADIGHEYESIGRSYDDMIQEFNRNQF